MRVALIGNGAKVRGAHAARIEDQLARRAPGAIVRWTSAPGETASLVREALAAGATRILAAGGDGTVHEAANALFGTEAELAVLPAGSGNDYARSLGVPPAIDAAIAFALETPALPTDAGEIEFTAPGGSSAKRIFVNIAQAGFGADVVRYSTTTVRLAPAWLGYQLAILVSLATLKRQPVSVSVDGAPARTVESSNLIVGLAQYFGGGMRPLPQARLDDGLFDIAHLRDCSRFDIARHAPLLKNGLPRDHPQIDQYRCRTVSTQSVEPVPVEADGEWLGFLPAKFSVLPGALRVVRRP